MENWDIIEEELASILEIYYNNSFAELTCDYIRHMGITVQEMELILEEMRKNVCHHTK